MLESLKGYLTIATGLTEVTLARAREVAAAVVAEGFNSGSGDVVGGVQELADELWTTGKDNREMLLQVVRLEVDRAVARMGFVREDELASLRRHVDRLEAQLASAQEDLAHAREDAAATSILAATDHDDDAQQLADSVVDSARRMAAMTGALASVPGLAGSPWARVAKDLATSAAGIVAAAGAAATSSAERGDTTGNPAAQDVGASPEPPAAKKTAKATAKKPAKKASTATAKKATKKSAPKSDKNESGKSGTSGSDS